MHDNRNWTVAVIRSKYYMKFEDVCKEVSKKTLQLPQGSIKSVDPSKKPRIVYFQYKPSSNAYAHFDNISLHYKKEMISNVVMIRLTCLRMIQTLRVRTSQLIDDELVEVLLNLHITRSNIK